MRFFEGTAWGGRRLWYWVPPVVFLLLNLGAFVIYQAVYADEAAVSRARLERSEEELTRLRARRAAHEDQLQRIVDSRQRVRELYQEDFASEAERLTQILRTVRQLARDASLEPKATSYPKEELEDYGLTKRSVTFGVQGTYFNLRKLINSLELSEHFLTLEDVGLGESGGRSEGQLAIDLKLSTLFADPDTDYGLDEIEWTPLEAGDRAETEDGTGAAADDERARDAESTSGDTADREVS